MKSSERTESPGTYLRTWNQALCFGLLIAEEMALQADETVVEVFTQPRAKKMSLLELVWSEALRWR